MEKTIFGAARGYTRSAEIRGILDRHESATRTGGISRFSGLTEDELRALLDHLPPVVRSIRADSGLSLAVALDLAARVPGVTFGGFRVGPERTDELIVVDSLIAPAEHRAVLEQIRGQLQPDDYSLGRTTSGTEIVEMWWD